MTSASVMLRSSSCAISRSDSARLSSSKAEQSSKPSSSVNKNVRLSSARIALRYARDVIGNEHYGFRTKPSLTDERHHRFVNEGGRLPSKNPQKAHDAFKAVGGPPFGPKESLKYDLN